MSAGTHKTIGQVADELGISAKAIRLYEARGLLPAPLRSSQGHRLFDEADLALLRFITRAKDAGLRLEDVKTVLNLQRDGHPPCGQVVAAMDQRIQDVERTISELSELRDRMRHLRDQTEPGQDPESGFCSIIGETPGRLGEHEHYA